MRLATECQWGLISFHYSEHGAPSLILRRQGHSALRIKDGKLEKFDPHPLWKWERGAMLPQSIEELELVVNVAIKAAQIESL